MKIEIAMKRAREIVKLIKSDEFKIYANKEITLYIENENIKLFSRALGNVFEKGAINIAKNIINSIDEEKVMVTDNNIQAGRLYLEYEKATIKNDVNHNKFGECVLKINIDELKDALECRYCLEKDLVRPILGYVYVDGNSFIALDGYRMSIRKISKKTTKSFYINKDLINVILKVKKYYGDVEFYLKDNIVTVKIGDITIIQRELKEITKPIDYKALIPNEFGTNIFLSRFELEELKETLKKNKNIYKDSRCIGLEILRVDSEEKVDAIKIKLKSGSTKISKVISATIEGTKLEIAFNGNYLFETLKKYDGEINIKMNTPISPIVIEKDNKFDMILPIRIIR